MRVIEEHLQNLSTTHINKHQSTRVNEIQWPTSSKNRGNYYI